MRWLCLILVSGTCAVASDGAGLSTTEFKKAEKLDKKKCYRCHKPYDPREYPPKEWDEWMARMSQKARLNEKDEELLKRYFQARRESGSEAP